MRLIVPIAAAALTLAGYSTAGELVVTLDPAATEIGFTLDAVAHTVHGTFRLASGEVRLDLATGAMGGELVVDATSGETGKKKRDRDMHEKVLESERFPTVVLRPSRLEGGLGAEGPSKVVVHGELEIHGERHDVAVPLTVTVGEGRVEAEGGFVVPYVAWGMKDPSFFVFRVGKTVDVRVLARGSVRGPAEP